MTGTETEPKNITSLISDHRDKVLAFSEILRKIGENNEKAILPILKRIEFNTSFLAKSNNRPAGNRPATIAQGTVSRTAPLRRRDEKGRFMAPPAPPEGPEKIKRVTTATARPVASPEVQIREKRTRNTAASAAAIPPSAISQVPEAVIEEAFPERERKGAASTSLAVRNLTGDRDHRGRFVGNSKSQEARSEQRDEAEKRSILQSLKRGFETIGGRGKTALTAKSGTLEEAAGRAAGGPIFEAAMELKDATESIHDEDSMVGKAAQWARKKTGILKAGDATKDGSRDEKGRFRVSHGRGDEPSEDGSKKVIETLKSSESEDEKRHEELIKAILKGDKGNGPESMDLPFFRKTGPGGARRGRTSKVQMPTGAASRSSKFPGMLNGGMMGKLGAMVTRIGPMLAALPLGTIAAGIAAVGAVGSAGYSAFTGKDNIISQFAQSLGLVPKINTDASGKITGGEVGTGRDTKFEQKYQQYAPAVKEASAKYGVPEDFMKTVMKIESNGNTNAVSSTGAKGLYQFTGGTAKDYGISGREFDPNANIDAAARLARKNANQLAKRNIPVTSENLYLAHQLGVGKAGKGGLSDLLNASQTGAPVSSALRKQMDVNGGKGMDARQFLTSWRRKYTEMAMAVGVDAKSNKAIAAKEQAEPLVQTATAEAPAEKPKAEIAGRRVISRKRTRAVQKEVAVIEGEAKKEAAAGVMPAATVPGESTTTTTAPPQPKQEPVASLATSVTARPTPPERITATMGRAAASISSVQGLTKQVGGSDMNGMLMAALNKLNSTVAKISGKDEATTRPGIPPIRTEFDDTMLTLMAYDRV